jgi:hypothetical protein
MHPSCSIRDQHEKQSYGNKRYSTPLRTHRCQFWIVRQSLTAPHPVVRSMLYSSSKSFNLFYSLNSRITGHMTQLTAARHEANDRGGIAAAKQPQHRAVGQL